MTEEDVEPSTPSSPARRAVVAGVVGALGATGALIILRWATEGGTDGPSSGSGFTEPASDFTAPPSSSAPTTGGAAWSRQIDKEGINATMGPEQITVGSLEVVAFTRDGMVHSVSRSDGSVRWQTPARLEATQSAIIFDAQVVVSVSGETLALDRTTGEVVWRSPADIQHMTLAGGASTLVRAAPTRVERLDLASGKTLWTMTGNWGSARTTENQVVVESTSSPGLVALDSGTGREQWRTRWKPLTTDGGSDSVKDMHIVADTVVALRGIDKQRVDPTRLRLEARHEVAVHNVNTGTQRWRRGYYNAEDTAATADRLLVCARQEDDRANVECLDLTTGRLVGYEAGIGGGFEAVADDLALVSDLTGVLAAVEVRTGRLRWSTPAHEQDPNRLLGPYAVIGDLAYSPLQNGLQGIARRRLSDGAPASDVTELVAVVQLVAVDGELYGRSPGSLHRIPPDIPFTTGPPDPTGSLPGPDPGAAGDADQGGQGGSSEPDPTDTGPGLVDSGEDGA